MNEIFVYLSRLSFGEFMVIWTFTILTILFYLFLLYYLMQIENDANILRINFKKISDLLYDEHQYRILLDG